MMGLTDASEVAAGLGEAARLARALNHDLQIGVLGTEPWPRDRALLRALIDQVPDLLFVKDHEGRFVVANIATALDLGQLSPDDLIGKTDADFYSEDLARKFLGQEMEVIRSGRPMIDTEERSWNSGAEEKWMSVTKFPLRNEAGAIIGLVGCCRDITERKREDRLRLGQAAILELIVRNTPLTEILDTLLRLVERECKGIHASILLLDEDGIHLRHCAAPSLPPDFARAIDGVAMGDKVGSCGTAAHRREAVVVSDITTDPLWIDFRDAIAPYGLRSCWSWPVLSADGAVLATSAMYCREARAPYPAEIQLAAFTTHIAGIAIQRKYAADHIQFLAHHDQLTGLPNRILLKERAHRIILAAARDHSEVAVIFMDLDNFKVVNDSLGHHAGDKLLKVIADRIRSCLSPTDIAARFGGDEFVLFLAETGPTEGLADSKIRRLRAAIDAPVEIDGKPFQMTSSMGVAHFPLDGISSDILIANADAALYHAKTSGRDNCQIFTSAMRRGVEDNLFKREDLRRGINEGELVLYYQPQVSLITGKLVGAEALVRWRHPQLGLVPPTDFVPLAEQTGLIVALGDWVLRTACVQNAAWQARGLPPITISVNVSTRQFEKRDWVARVAAALSGSGLGARFLELELTESLIMRDPRNAIETMEALRVLGVQIAIDDFGTGYSSLSSLKSFPISSLKIDQSFVKGLPDILGDTAITTAVIELGHRLNLRVIAEGVETLPQIAFLKANGCDDVQGYYVSRPLPARAFEKMLCHPSTELLG